MSDIAKRFAVDTAEHRMTVLHDDGLYRHLRFRSPKNSFYWFELITVPGSLIFRGDGQSFVFARLEDMFEFFRGQRVNPHYWAEKLTSCREEGARKYDRDIFERQVKETFSDLVRHGGAPVGVGLGRAISREVLDPDGAWSEEDAHRILRDFTFYANEDDRYGRHETVDGKLTWIPGKEPDFEFGDTWEWDFRDYDWWFLWALHGIVWGIAQYDAAQGAPAAGGVLTAQTAGGVL